MNNFKIWIFAAMLACAACGKETPPAGNEARGG